MKNIKNILMIMALSLLFVFGCSNGNNEGAETEKESSAEETTQSETPETIKIGITAVSKISYDAIEPLYNEMGYTTEPVMFDSNPVVLEAVNSGEVHIGLGQHKKFMETFNNENNGDLAMVQPYAYYTGIGLYSDKYDSVEEIPDGAKIAIMNDPQNRGIALRILEDQGLITLADNVENPTVADITENPKNLEIIEVEQNQAVSSIQDVDAATVFFTHMSNAGLDPNEYIARDVDMINYPMGPIVRAENKDATWAVDYAKCFKDDEVRSKIDEQLPGVFEYYEDDSEVSE